MGRDQGAAPDRAGHPRRRQSGSESYNTYAGTGGVRSATRSPVRSTRPASCDINLLLSDRVNSQSQDPLRPHSQGAGAEGRSVADGRHRTSTRRSWTVALVWIVDGYTTSNTYPNSQRMTCATATADTPVAGRVGSQVDENVNYIRNSVKAVVDAYDGTVTLYAWDETDPMLQAYDARLPRHGSSRRAPSAPTCCSHLRYPEDLFKVQREILGRYHMTNPDTWYASNRDLWEVPNDPVQANTDAQGAAVLPVASSGRATSSRCSARPRCSCRTGASEPGRLPGGERRREQSGLRQAAGAADVRHAPDRRSGSDLQRDQHRPEGRRRCCAPTSTRAPRRPPTATC